jgi:NitT/TauT family transport system substrate-binding protein
MEMKDMFSFSIKAKAFATATLILSLSFGGLAQADEHPMGDGTTIRLLTNPAGTMSFPPFVIERFGLEEKYGFQLEPVTYSDENSIVAAIMGDSADAAAIDWFIMARLRQNGVPLLATVPFLTFVNSVIVPMDSPAQTLADLEDARFGVHSRAAYDWLMIQAAARETYGLDNFASYVQLQEAAVPLLRGLMEQEQLEATQMWNSIAAAMLTSGEYRTLVSIRDLSEQMGFGAVPYLIYAFDEDFIAEHPETVRAFEAAMQEVYEILMTDDSVWEDRGGEMNMSPEAIIAFRDQVRRDITPVFEDDAEETYFRMFDTLLQTAGEEILGMNSMPDRLLATDF